jgi:phospholipase/lecithinase/hemolysin
MKTTFGSLRPAFAKATARQATFCLTLAVIALTAVTAAEGTTYDSFYVFGDSLADNGNVFLETKALGMNPAVPPSESPHRTYFSGRFSNGPIAFEYLWGMLSGQPADSPGGLQPFLASPFAARTPAVSFAFAGTGTEYIDQTPGGFYAPGLKGQIELFRLALRGRRPSRHALFALATGANDYRIDPFNQPMEPEEVVGNLSDAVRRLYQLGARHIIVLNLPDLGRIPANSGMSEYWTELSNQHNRLLMESLTRLASRLPGIKLIHVDVNQVFGLLPAEMDRTMPALDVFFPPEFLPPGFRMSLCLFINPATCADVPTFDTGARYLFWDAVHPTTEAYQVLAEHIYNGLH